MIKNQGREFTLVASKLTNQFVTADQIYCAWSPDSKCVSVSVYHNKISDLYMVDLSGPEPKVVSVVPLEKTFLERNVKNRSWERISRQSLEGRKWEADNLLAYESGACISGDFISMYRADYLVTFDGRKIIRHIENN